MAQGFKDEDGKFHPTDGGKKVRDISDDDTNVEVSVTVGNEEELEEFAKQKAEEIEEEEKSKLTKMQQDIVDKLNDSSMLSEKDVNYIKNTLNGTYVSGKEKLTSFDDELLALVEENTPELTSEQTTKGLDWLKKQSRKRVNNPFGNREFEIIENFKEFRLASFFNAARNQGQWVDFYVPVYRVVDNDGDSFEYYIYGGELHYY